MKRKIYISIIQIFLLMVIGFSMFTTTHATGDYTLLAPLPEIGDANNKVNFNNYLPAVFRFAIMISAGMAFAVITFGGIVYATSDAINSKSEGRKWIEDAIVGLLLVIGAYVILNTINPKILEFNFKVEKITAKKATTVVSAEDLIKEQDRATTPGGTTGCAGDCPYSYQSGNETIRYQNCSGCRDLLSFGFRSEDVRHLTPNGQSAQINTSLGEKLKTINDDPNISDLVFTETWPPTSNHAAQGQYNGTSVDVKLKNVNAQEINKFVAKANGLGLTANYEVKTDAERAIYIQMGVMPSYIKVVSRATGEHFSVCPISARC